MPEEPPEDPAPDIPPDAPPETAPRLWLWEGVCAAESPRLPQQPVSSAAASVSETNRIHAFFGNIQTPFRPPGPPVSSGLPLADGKGVRQRDAEARRGRLL